MYWIGKNREKSESFLMGPQIITCLRDRDAPSVGKNRKTSGRKMCYFCVLVVAFCSTSQSNVKHDKHELMSIHSWLCHIRPAHLGLSCGRVFRLGLGFWSWCLRLQLTVASGVRLWAKATIKHRALHDCVFASCIVNRLHAKKLAGDKHMLIRSVNSLETGMAV